MRLSPQLKSAFNLMGVQGLFWFAWAFANYQTAYLQDNGMTSSEVGILNAVSAIVGIFASIFWGFIADRMNSVKKAVMIELTAMAVLFGSIPFLPVNARYATVMFIAYCAAAYFAKYPVSSLVENLTVRNCEIQRLNYGVIRAFGSFCFTIGSVLSTMMLTIVSVKYTFWATALFMIFPVLCIWFSNDPKVQKAPKVKGSKKDIGKLFGNYYYVTFLVFIGLLYVPLSAEFGFITYLMEDRGISNTNIGTLLALRAALEIPFLLFMGKIRQRVRLKYIVMMTGILMGIECLLFGLFTYDFTSLMCFACFYGAGNGLFIGSVSLYVYRLAPDSLKASAQSIYVAVSSAFSIIGYLAGGFAYEMLGGGVFYVVLGVIFIAASVFFIITFLTGKIRGIENPADQLG